MKIKFYDKIDDIKIKFAVIIAIHNGKFVLCKHKDRNTFEIPGGHHENYESVVDAAKRELIEETGAAEFEIKEICPYSVNGKDGIIETREETFGMLFYAEILKFKDIKSEIEKIEFFDEFPNKNLTYPIIHTSLFKKYIDNRKKWQMKSAIFYENKFLYYF